MVSKKRKGKRSGYSAGLYKGACPDVSALSATVKIAVSKNRGRHILALEDIPPGSLVLRDRAFAFSVFDECAADFCDACAEPIDRESQNLFICTQCNDKTVVFCSEQCRENAWKAYHRYECGRLRKVLHFIGQQTKDPANASSCRIHNVILAVRVLVQTPLATLTAYYRSCHAEKNPKKSNSAPTQKITTVEQQFQSIMSLMDDSDIDIADDANSGRPELCRFLIDQLSVRGILKEPGWPEDWSIQKRETVLAEVLLDIMTRLRRNLQGIWELRPVSDELKSRLNDGHKATGVFTVGALMNHSCYPNVHVVYGRDCYMEARVIRPIKKGDELVHCYGPRMGVQCQIERQYHLWTDLYFKCRCLVCTQPAYQQLDYEMTALKCIDCASAVKQETLECMQCEKQHHVSYVNELKLAIATFMKKIDANSMATLDVMNELDRWSTLVHEQHQMLTAMRFVVSSYLIKKDEPELANEVMAQLMVNVGRSYGPFSLKAVSVWLKLAKCNKLFCPAKAYLCASFVMWSYFNHFGPEFGRHEFLRVLRSFDCFILK